MNMAKETSTRKTMRHSSWTLFLVPLTLPLLLFCLPGSMRSGGKDPGEGGQVYERIQEPDLSAHDGTVISLGSGEEGSWGAPEALFRD